jgi:predicted TIM-barrel fold metal-dependent hydrolase
LLIGPLVNCSRSSYDEAASQTDGAYYSSRDFTRVPKRDAHVHINTSDPAIVHQAAADNFSLLTINVDTTAYPPIDQQESIAVGLMKAFPDRVTYATTFTVAGFNSPGWRDQALQHVTASLARGAVAVKFWKNIGMELKDAQGRFVAIDDAAFDPLIEFIAGQGVSIIGHVGEPRNCWLPLAQMTVQSDRTYYEGHPQYHMYLHPEYPSYEQHLQARDRMLTKHPTLTFVGAHLASLEWSVDELAKRLDQFPQMSVDLAARMPHLQQQASASREKVRKFFIDYQDRLIYGTDQAVGPKRDPSAVRSRAHQIWTLDWKFLTSGDVLDTASVEGTVKGLQLPREVVDKVYRLNAERTLGGTRSPGGH